MKLQPSTILVSLALHGTLAALLWVYAKPHVLPDPPKVMQAVLLPALPASQATAPSIAPPVAAPAPAPLPPPPEPVPPKPRPEPPKPPKPQTKPEPPKVDKPAPPKPVPPKPTATPVAPKKPEKPKPAIDDKRLDDEIADVEAESKRVAKEQAEKRRREAEARQQALADAMKDDADALAAAAAADARARQMAAQIGEFTRAIDRKVKSVWRLPPNTAAGMATEMRITLLPGGEVASVLVTRSSGSNALDASAVEAVRRASPLPVPSDPVLFREQFKVLTLKLKSED